MAHNTIDFFRFSDKSEDVFVEDDHYLYATAEPFSWPYMFACNPYRILDDGTLLREDTIGAAVEYLESLERADSLTAERIIGAESKRTLKFSEAGMLGDE